MKINVLDAGYLILVDKWGSDERIIEAARMSTDKGFQGWGNGVDVVGDEKLLRYLWTNKHHTPFEMAGLTIEVKAPLFVFREWHRHRTQSYNELSARYTTMPNENYVPGIARCLLASGANKQANSLNPPNELGIQDWLDDLESFYIACEKFYQRGLDLGVPKEIARVIIPVGRYSRMRASANLRNWLAFITLRADTKAQLEIRQYAYALGELIKATFPRTWEVYNQLDKIG